MRDAVQKMNFNNILGNLNPFTLLRFIRDRAVRRLIGWIRIQEGQLNVIRVEMLKRQMKRCGRDFHLYGPICLRGAYAMEVGDNVHIGENAYIRADGGLTIGDNTRISRNLLLYTVNHRFKGELLPYEEGDDAKPVIIGKNVWIGMNVCIAPGTVIGDGAVIGMGTTVAGEVPQCAIVVSAKWRLVGSRNRDDYQRLDEKQYYADPDGKAYRPAPIEVV